jgi:hypothetical protein
LRYKEKNTIIASAKVQGTVDSIDAHVTSVCSTPNNAFIEAAAGIGIRGSGIERADASWDS